MVKAKRDINVGPVVTDYRAMGWTFLFGILLPHLQHTIRQRCSDGARKDSVFDIRITTPTSRMIMDRMTTGTSRQLVGK